MTEKPEKRSLASSWNSFFFTSADARPLAAIRVIVGGLLLWDWAWLGVDLNAYLKSDGWADPAAVQALQPPAAWSLWAWIPDGFVVATWAFGLLVFMALACGLASRTVAWLAWAFAVSTMRRVPVMLFGFDNVIVIWTFYLAVSCASGQAWSVDRLIGRRLGRAAPEASIEANLGLRLIQLHLCLIYASAGLAKLQGTPWWDGRAVGMLLGNSEFRPFDLTFLSEEPALLELATHFTVALELLYPVLIWNRAWRPWLLAGAVLMHLGIAVAMGLTEFSLAMLAGSLSFVPPGWFAAASRLVGRRNGLSRVESQQTQPIAGPAAASRDPRRSRS